MSGSGRRSMAAKQEPLWVGEIDLADPATGSSGRALTPTGAGYRRARILVRFQGEPLGLLTLPLTDGTLDAEAARVAAVEQYRDRLDAVAGTPWTLDAAPRPGLPESLQALADGAPPAVSVVIGTRNRPDHVIECVQWVLKQHYPSPIEVIVVDNGASDGATRAAIAAAYENDDRVRYMTEVRPGLARARNIGLSAARYPITAFLSDDIRVDPLWLLAVARGFERHPDVSCVTGICPPAYLDTTEQLLFESAMAWGSRQGYEPIVHRYHSDTDRLHPYRTGSFATGANMSFRTERFRQLGGFDENLGPGTLARGGEDLDAPVRVLAAGDRVAFEPAAIGWHADRFDDRPFTAHLYTYGLGLTAFLAKHLTDRRLRGGLLRRIPAGLPVLLRGFDEPDDVLRHEFPIPLRYHLWHLAGRAMGPLAYVRSRWSASR
ncbi:MAG: glycosyltransferase family A protein [Actinomycetota bacterium]